jgi:hypothetical protein
MRTTKGGIYRVRVLVEGIAAVHPSWLVAAAATTWKKAEVVELTPIGQGRVDLIVRWTGSPGEISEGDVLSPMTEGMTAPQLPLPEATVEEVEPITIPQSLTTLRSLEQPTGFERADYLKLALSVALIGTTAYLSRRIA